MNFLEGDKKFNKLTGGVNDMTITFYLLLDLIGINGLKIV